MDPNLWSSIVRKSPTWKPEDYESLDALRQFCVEMRETFDSGRVEGMMFVLWPNVTYAVWGALRAREARNMPREPSLDEVMSDWSVAVRSLDEVIRWCDPAQQSGRTDVQTEKGNPLSNGLSRLAHQFLRLWQTFRHRELRASETVEPIEPATTATTEAGKAARAEGQTKLTKLDEPISKSELRAIWLAKAMLLVQDNPHLSDAKIAEMVGKDKSTLSRSREFQATSDENKDSRVP